MSRRNFSSSGPPVESSRRGIPSAGQTPDPSWFGRRAHGERHEQHRDPISEAVDALRARVRSSGAMLDSTGAIPRVVNMYPPTAHCASNHRVVVSGNCSRRNPPAADEPTRRETKEAAVTVEKGYGGEMHAHVSVNTDLLPELSPQELANILADVMAKVAAIKRPPQASALHPGARSRKLRLD